MAVIWAILLAIAPAPATAEIPEDQLLTQVNDKEVFPAAFRGVWSKNGAECRDKYSLYTFEVTENRLYGYEWDALLLKSTPNIGQTGPKPGQWANTVVVLTADRGESDVAYGKRRISLMDGKLYMSRPDEVSEAAHFTSEYAYVRCP